MLEYQNIKIFLQKAMFQIGLKTFLWSKKLKRILTYVNGRLNREEIAGTLYKKELQKTNYKKLGVEKVINRNSDKLYVKWNS